MGITLTVALVAALSAAQDGRKNHRYEYWSGFKSGYWAKTKVAMETRIGGKSLGTTKIDLKVTLVKFTAEKAVLESRTIQNIGPLKSEGPPSRVEYRPGGRRDGALMKEGEEEIQVAGKKFKCRWLLFKDVQDGIVDKKFWLSREIPGGVAKTEITRSGETKPYYRSEIVSWENK